MSRAHTTCEHLSRNCVYLLGDLCTVDLKLAAAARRCCIHSQAEHSPHDQLPKGLRMRQNHLETTMAKQRSQDLKSICTKTHIQTQTHYRSFMAQHVDRVHG